MKNYLPWILLALAGYLLYSSLESPPGVPKTPSPQPDPLCPGPNCPKPSPKPKPSPSPWGTPSLFGSLPTIGGKTFQTFEIMTDLPSSEKKKNVGGKDGAGLCVFTSIEWSARWQNERKLFDLQKYMRGEPGGGYPEKVDKMLAKYAPGVKYVQHTGGDLEFLKLAMKTGRMPGITYGGYDPHYRGYVSHMVNLVYLDDSLAAISDNNFPADDQIVWMSTDEFAKRWRMGGGGWAVVLLSGPPSPAPKN